MEKIISFLKKNNINNIDKKITLLRKYKEMLISESKHQSLISKNTFASIEDIHFLDSAYILQYFNFKGKKIADVGSGAGLPGIVLKILNDDLKITLIEPRKKRCLFLKKVIEILDLNNCFVINSKSQDVKQKFDFVISRAVSKTINIINWTKHLLTNDGSIILYKTENYLQEEDFPRNLKYDLKYYKIDNKELTRVFLYFNNRISL